MTFSSCDLSNSTDSVVYSSDPSFYSLTFAENDSVADLETAVFTLEYDALLNDSVIVNLDSLPYKTRIDSVYATFTFKSTAGSYFVIGTEKTYMTGKDTLDFTKSMSILNYAADQVKSREYPIKVNVHTVDPEVYNWRKVNNGIYSHAGDNQRTVVFNNTFYMYVNNGSQNYLYTSGDGASWSATTVTGLPTVTSLKNIIEFNSKLYLADDAGSKIYSSANGKDWVALDYQAENFTFKSLLYVMDSKLWAITKSKTDNSYHIANSTDGSVWIVRSEIEDNFPVSDFAAISFFSRAGNSKALIVGGTSKDGDRLVNCWSTEDGYYWVDFSVENSTLDALNVGASIISYDDKLLLFGSKSKSSVLVNNYLVSKDEGLSWSTPDTLYNRLREPVVVSGDTTYTYYTPRSFQSVVLFKSDLTNKTTLANRIFVIGGKTQTATLTNVWSGKLNRFGFLRD